MMQIYFLYVLLVVKVNKDVQQQIKKNMMIVTPKHLKEYLIFSNDQDLD